MNIEDLKRRIKKEVLEPMDTIKLDESMLKNEAEEAGFDYSAAKKVANAELEAKEGLLRTKLQTVIDYI